MKKKGKISGKICWHLLSNWSVTGRRRLPGEWVPQVIHLRSVHLIESTSEVEPAKDHSQAWAALDT